ncbi:proliferation-associated protein 2G4-like protein [Syncephalis fuscata]|nr:proliferation-associated protein 2G4-like protein [Syncephalis fuscata]
MSTVEKSEAPVVDATINNSDVVTKYTKAADIANRALAKVTEACVADAKLIDVCNIGDEFITAELKGVYAKGKVPKGIAFPTTVTPNHIVCHLNPLANDPEANITIADGDVLKIVLGAQIDGFCAVAGHTIVVGASEASPVTGAKADVITAAHVAGEAVLRMMTPGRSNKSITETVDKIAAAYNVKAVEGMMSYQQEQNEVDGGKSIILNPNEQQRRDYKEEKIEAGEVYCIDMIMSTGDGKARPSQMRTTIYKKTNNNYQLKVAASRVLFSEIKQKFGNFPFTLRALEDSNKARLAIPECTKTGVIYPYPIFVEKTGDTVAQIQYTVFVTANGPVRITSTPALDTAVIQSEQKIEDEEINALLAQTLAKKKKKNKKRSGKSTTA